METVIYIMYLLDTDIGKFILLIVN